MTRRRGFRPSETKGLTLNAASTARADATLEVGAAAQAIEVQAAAEPATEAPSEVAEAAAAGAESAEDISMDDVLGSKGRKAPASADDESTVESKTV